MTVPPAEMLAARGLDFQSIGLVPGLKPQEQPSIGEMAQIVHDLSPHLLRKERLIAQWAEIHMINHDATGIFNLLKEKGLPLPSAYGVFTAGFDVPENATHLGKYGEEGPFIGFPQPEIAGHSGDAYAVQLEDGKIALILKGRGHPNEWKNERFSGMVLAHPLRVVKEMVRRQRADDGLNPPVALSYLTGVTEGYKMQPGDLAVIRDDTELTNVDHPGMGPHELLELYDGPHFQAKMGRSSHREAANLAVDVARENGLKLYTAAVMGTPGTPEYQSKVEVELFREAFERARKAGLEAFTGTIVPGAGDGEMLLAPLFDMGITFEEAIWRKIFNENADPAQNEDDFLVTAFALATDLVGGKQSEEVNHAAIVAKALSTAPRNLDFILKYFNAINRNKLTKTDKRIDFSIRTKLAKEQTREQTETTASEA